MDFVEKKQLIIDKSVIDLPRQNPRLKKYMPDSFWFEKPDAGYGLLLHVGQFCSEKFGEFEFDAFDVGTYLGTSAVCLNDNLITLTYDIKDWIKDHYCNDELKESFYDFLAEGVVVGNKEFIFNSLKSDLEQQSDLAYRSLIFLDVDPHDGIQEQEYYKMFKEVGVDGILLLDDIHLNEGMSYFWNTVRSDRDVLTYDVTEYGHRNTGTGLVLMGSTKDKIEVVLK